MVKVAGGYYLTRAQIHEYAKREHLDIRVSDDDPDLVSLYKLNTTIRQRGFTGVKLMSISYPRGSLRKRSDEQPADVFLLVTRWGYDDRDIGKLSDVEPFEENDRDRAVRARLVDLGFKDTKFVTVPDPHHEFNEDGDYMMDDEVQEDDGNAGSSGAGH